MHVFKIIVPNYNIKCTQIFELNVGRSISTQQSTVPSIITHSVLLSNEYSYNTWPVEGQANYIFNI